MSLWTYYRSLTPRTRMLLGASVIAYAIGGLYVSDALESRLGLEPSDEDRRRLAELVPSVRTVERSGSSGGGGGGEGKTSNGGDGGAL